MGKRTRDVPKLELPRAKVTITLRRDRLAYADRKARERDVSRSEMIDAMIAEAEEHEIEGLMVAGYKSMAQEDLQLAEEGMESFWEVIEHDPEWPGAPERSRAEG